MNEILAVIYYVIHEDNCKYNETDAFFCFNLLMIEAKEGFIRDLDGCYDGMKGRVKTMDNLL